MSTALAVFDDIEAKLATLNLVEAKELRDEANALLSYLVRKGQKSLAVQHLAGECDPSTFSSTGPKPDPKTNAGMTTPRVSRCL